MAPRTKLQLPVGSAQWIQDENRQIGQFFTQEVEDFSFSARNEIEWLNEHMAEIFSKNQVNVTEILKTPGKLRGKTPRTIRKRNAMEVRQPLTDMFTTNAPLNTSRLHAGTPSKAIPQFRVAADPIVSATPKLGNPKHTDSGYHGTSEDDMDVDVPPAASSLPIVQEKTDSVVAAEMVADEVHEPTIQKTRERTTEGSFHSAKEEIPMTGTHNGGPEAVKDSIDKTSEEIPDQPVHDSCLPQATTVTEVIPNETMDLVEIENDSVLVENPSLDALHSSSADSTPAKTLLRKSSLTFAALPAREPLTTKKSIGTRNSGTTHYDHHRGTLSRGSVLGRYTGGKSLGGSRQPDPVQDQPNEEMDVDKAEKPAPHRDELNADSNIARFDDKSSTQRLNEKLNKLGDAPPSAPSKSHPGSASDSQPLYPTLTSKAQLSYFEQTATKTLVANGPTDNDDDDWIQPPPIPKSDLKRPETDIKSQSSDRENIVGKKPTDNRGAISLYESVALKESSSLEKIIAPGPTRDENEPPRPTSAPNLRSPLKGGETGQLKTADKSALALNSAIGADNLPKTITTPYGTPSSKRYVDGPLSASKSKLQSIMKTARGLFTSSAGVSAQAKMETLSPHSMKTRGQTRAPTAAESLGSKLKPTSSKETLSSHASTDLEARRIEEQVKSKASEPTTEGRRTRSSAEKDERRKEKEAMEEERKNQERQGGKEAIGQRAQMDQRELTTPAMPKGPHVSKETTSTMASTSLKPVRQSPRRAQNLQEAEKQAENQQVQPALGEEGESGSGAVPLQTNPSLVQKPKELRRPVKPVKEAPSKSKPQPVAIRVGMLSQRMPLMNPAVPSGLQENTAAPPQRPPGPVKKPSNASISSNNLKSSVSSNVGKPKALLAAERKKEQDEKELQRKMDQKREIERKRAAQQEELRRQEQAQQQEAERQREKERLAAAAASDPKKLAQRQAIEKRRLENGRKEQQRQASQQEKNPAVPTNRQELGGSRPPSRLHGFGNNDYGRSANPPPSGAVRPPGKRVFEPDIDEEPKGPAHGQGGSSLYPQLEAKRRRTDDEEFLEVVVRPTMLPPKRQSNARKDGPKQSIFGNGYASSHTYHQSSSLLKTSTLNQTYQQHQQLPSQVSRTGLPHEMAKYTNGKIPFAEAPNPPPPKSPLRAARPAAPPAAKSSPQYINGENIELAEIPTDSEDEDSGDEKAKGGMLPEWVQSPLLRQQLEIQERYVDADAVFGPARSPHMEEMFKGREHRFRNRTSSANWAGPDRLTEEEIRNDRAGREKLRRQGGWTFEL